MASWERVLDWRFVDLLSEYLGRNIARRCITGSDALRRTPPKFDKKSHRVFLWAPYSPIVQDVIKIWAKKPLWDNGRQFGQVRVGECEVSKRIVVNALGFGNQGRIRICMRKFTCKWDDVVLQALNTYFPAAIRIRLSRASTPLNHDSGTLMACEDSFFQRSPAVAFTDRNHTRGELSCAHLTMIFFFLAASQMFFYC